MTRTRMSAFFWIPSQSDTFLKEKNSPVHLLLLVLVKVTVLMHVSLLHGTVQMVVLILKL